jgi:hypothetical protein
VRTLPADRSATDQFPLRPQNEKSSGAAVKLRLVEFITELSEEPNAAEGYLLQVSPADGVSISAQTRAGLFYGVQSLLQLLPSTPPDMPESGESGISVPAVQVRSCAHQAEYAASWGSRERCVTLSVSRMLLADCVVHTIS